METPTWLPSPNFTPGRPLDPNKVNGPQAPVSYIILHHTWCTLTQADHEFQNDHGGNIGDPNFTQRRSVHFAVDEGTVHQYVKLADSSWGAGNWAGNCGGINIELVEYEGHPVTQGTVNTAIDLVTELCERFNLVPHPTVILPHNHFINTACPGTVPVAAIINAVRDKMAMPSHPVTVIAASAPPPAPVIIPVSTPVVIPVVAGPDEGPHQAYDVEVIALSGANVRVGKPYVDDPDHAGQKVPISTSLKKGDVFKAHSVVMGQGVDGVPSQNTTGTNVWYLSEVSYQAHKDSNGVDPLHYVWSGACKKSETTQSA